MSDNNKRQKIVISNSLGKIEIPTPISPPLHLAYRRIQKEISIRYWIGYELREHFPGVLSDLIASYDTRDYWIFYRIKPVVYNPNEKIIYFFMNITTKQMVGGSCYTFKDLVMKLQPVNCVELGLPLVPSLNIP